ncbi:MAG: glycosyltransferase [Saccharospirillaceae bacterium]|nr:hypothetical protein A3759_07080 [Thalassolituus sp. HI0120]MCH2041655.1 glycosyltransferase [Saccharospirillaceae bacterium]
MLPKVSVISGYYNRESLVSRTVESLLAQSYENLEIILFDDASTDGTFQKLKEYKENNTNIRLIRHEKNIGFVQGLIDAISTTDSEYIAIQSSGDVSLPLRIEKQVKLLEKQRDVSVVGCFYKNIIESSGLQRKRTPSANGMSKEELLRGNVYSHGEVMFRRSSYDQAGGYRKQFKFCQDYDLWLRMIQVGKLATVEEELFHRFVQFSGVSYLPEKSVAQAKYSFLARSLANGSLPDCSLLEVETQGVDTIVSDSAIQRRIFSNSIRAVLWRDFEGAIGFTKYFDSEVAKLLIRSLVFIGNTMLGRGVLNICQGVVGVKSYK